MYVVAQSIIEIEKITWASSVSLYIGSMRLRPHSLTHSPLLLLCSLTLAPRSVCVCVWKTDDGDDDDGYTKTCTKIERGKKYATAHRTTYREKLQYSLARLLCVSTITGWWTNNWLARVTLHTRNLHPIVLLHAVSSRFCLSLSCVFSYFQTHTTHFRFERFFPIYDPKIPENRSSSHFSLMPTRPHMLTL